MIISLATIIIASPTMVILEISIIVLLLLILFRTSRRMMGKFIRLPNTNLVHNAVGPGKDASDGSVKYLGTFDSAGQCEASCGTDEWCNAYTWQTASAGDYAKQCYGMNVKQTNIPNSPNTQSGYKRYPSTAESFDPKAAMDRARIAAQSAVTAVSRRLGGQPAGKTSEPYRSNSTVGSFDSFKENFQFKGDVGIGTDWAGYQGRSSIPDTGNLKPNYASI